MRRFHPSAVSSLGEGDVGLALEVSGCFEEIFLSFLSAFLNMHPTLRLSIERTWRKVKKLFLVAFVKKLR